MVIPSVSEISQVSQVNSYIYSIKYCRASYIHCFILQIFSLQIIGYI